MTEHPIGILDSGLGGLTIWQEIRRQLPDEPTIYIGDHAYRPYGEKPVKQIRDRVMRLMTFLLTKGVKLIVIGCNTATVAGIDTYRRWYPDIPIIGVVPVIKTAAQLTRTGSIAVLSTPFTSKSRYQKRLIQTFASGCRVTNIGCPGLGTLVEEDKIDEQAKTLLAPLLESFPSKRIDVLVLGCTHYPFVKDTMQDIVGDGVTIIDSAGAVARHTGRILAANKLRAGAGKPYTVFYTTGDANKVSRVATKLTGERITFTYGRV